MSVSLGRQVLQGEAPRECFQRLAKWIHLSEASTLVGYYDTWGSLQADKEGPSTMTNPGE